MDEIHDSGYQNDCDRCLYDLHHCPLCDDVVGHNHFHEWPLTDKYVELIVQVFSIPPLEGT
jgi:hypothetical protein